MTPQRVLVTGASGFLGARVAEKLHEHDHLLGLILKTPHKDDRAASIYPDCEIIEGNLAKPESYSDAIRAFKPDTLIHAAWDGTGGDRRNEYLQVANISATASLLEAAIDAGVKYFIGIGSQLEYGPHDGPLDETAETYPTNLYGCSKLAACNVTESMCRLADIRHAWIRVFWVYGPRDNPNRLIPDVIQRLRSGKVPPLTAGEQQWDFLYIDDAADAIVSVIESTSASGTFNLGSAHGATLRRTVTMLRDLINSELPLGFGQVPYSPDQIMFLKADIRRLTQATGWAPKVDLQTGLAQTLQWYSSNLGERT